MHGKNVFSWNCVYIQRNNTHQGRTPIIWPAPLEKRKYQKGCSHMMWVYVWSKWQWMMILRYRDKYAIMIFIYMNNFLNYLIVFFFVLRQYFRVFSRLPRFDQHRLRVRGRLLAARLCDSLVTPATSLGYCVWVCESLQEWSLNSLGSMSRAYRCWLQYEPNFRLQGRAWYFRLQMWA